MGSYRTPHTEIGSWSFVGGLGYIGYNFGYHGGAFADYTAQNAIDDGQTAVGRFAIARNLTELIFVRLGLGWGVQSGNTLRLDIPQATLNGLGGLPVQANIKPMLDLLVTATINPLMDPLYLVF